MIKLKVEIADHPESLAKGLMGVKHLPSNNGMLFKFPSVIEASFWGKNTYIPLDIAFIGKDNKIADINSIVPMSTRMIRSKNPCIMAIEANYGFFKKNGIGVGKSVEIIKSDKDTEVIFKDS